MALVKAPLLSLGASGTIGNAIVFSRWKGRDYCRRHVIPANPRSAGQLSIRAMLRFLSQEWDGLSSAEKTSWDDRAAATNISAFNAFAAYNLARWGTAALPSKNDPAALDDAGAVIANEDATAGSRSALVEVEVTTLNQNWGIMIYRDDSGPCGVTRNLLVRVIPAESAAVFTWLDFPLTPNVAVHYAVRAFSEAGVSGNTLDNITCTPTV